MFHNKNIVEEEDIFQKIVFKPAWDLQNALTRS